MHLGSPRPGRWNGAPDLLPPQHRAVDVFRPLKSHLGYPTQLSRAGVDPVAAQSAGTIADTYTLEVRILGYRPPERSVDVTNLLGAMYVHHLKATNLTSGQLLV